MHCRTVRGIVCQVNITSTSNTLILLRHYPRDLKKRLTSQHLCSQASLSPQKRREVCHHRREEKRMIRSRKEEGSELGSACTWVSYTGIKLCLDVSEWVSEWIWLNAGSSALTSLFVFIYTVCVCLASPVSVLSNISISAVPRIVVNVHSGVYEDFIVLFLLSCHCVVRWCYE